MVKNLMPHEQHNIINKTYSSKTSGGSWYFSLGGQVFETLGVVKIS